MRLFSRDNQTMEDQKFFRELLAAMSRPETMRRISCKTTLRAEQVGVPWPVWSICSALLDERVGVCDLDPVASLWASLITQTLDSKHAAVEGLISSFAKVQDILTALRR